MALKINLLPPESTVSGPMGQLIKITRALNIILLGGFILFAFGLSAFFIFNSLKLQNINSEIAQLKSSVSAQESSEQQVVLLKDRLGKVQLLQSLPSSMKNMVNIDNFLATIEGNATLTELDVDSQKTDISMLFRNNADLSNFLRSITSSKLFKSATLSSFGFNPASGYLVSIHLI